ncbi:hypothetical protein DL769_006101 [Monosporascus sp. CRB-8-3]|nr:hypothetical protein DL769_006101 [Monosporascus sp. CRB-8-3]
MAGQVLVLDIPYEGDVSLPGYLYLPPPSKRLPESKASELLTFADAGSPQGELHYLIAAVGVGLGYAVLMFDRPGQGTVLRQHGIPLRPDHEAVTAPRRDPSAPALPRAPRPTAPGHASGWPCAAPACSWPCGLARAPASRRTWQPTPFYCLWDVATTRMPAWYAALWTTGWLPKSIFKASGRAQIATSFPMRWEFALGMVMMGSATPGDTLPRFRSSSTTMYRKGRKAPGSWTSSSVRSYSRARRAPSTPRRRTAPWPFTMRSRGVPESAKELWIPEEGGLGGLTAKAGAWELLAQKTFQFLDKHFGIHRGHAKVGKV